jgi:hypothetical protein
MRKIRVSRYSGSETAVGEVASINGSKYIIYLYPERYPEISIGDILLIDSGIYHPIIVVDENIHRARREQGFTPLHTGHDELKEIYPDADRLYIYAISGVNVAYADEKGSVKTGFGPSPRLHDFAYDMEEEDKERLFLDEGDTPNFTILRYLLHGARDPILLREFIARNRDVITKLGDEREVFSAFFNAITEMNLGDAFLKTAIDDFLSIMGWRE